MQKMKNVAFDPNYLEPSKNRIAGILQRDIYRPLGNSESKLGCKRFKCLKDTNVYVIPD